MQKYSETFNKAGEWLVYGASNNSNLPSTYMIKEFESKFLAGIDISIVRDLLKKEFPERFI